MAEILIVGGVTLDTLHFSGQTATAPGGAGLYTALAAQKAGSPTTLFAQKPQPLPKDFVSISQAVTWIGPIITSEELPQLEIAHYGGGKAELLHAHWGAQAHLTPAELPLDMSNFDYIHLAVMVTPQRQLDFLKVCRERSTAMISAGTNGNNAHQQTALVQQLITETDIFFMNENEAIGVFGAVSKAFAAPEKLLFVTLGEQGAWAIEANIRTHIPARATKELDPTGAGDTFCGTVLASLAQGHAPTEAAHSGIAAATQTIQGIGPEKLL